MMFYRLTILDLHLYDVQFGLASSAQPVFECRFAACRRQLLLNMTLMLNGAGDAA